MQLLTFTIGAEDYAIESRRVVEVVPFVAARPIPRTPDFIRGIFTHRGRLIPLVDLGWLLIDTPLRETLSTRVIVVEFSLGPCSLGPGDQRIRLGVAAENVVSLCFSSEAETSSPALPASDAPALAPALGRLLRIGGRTVQVLDVERLLPVPLLAGLVAAAPASTGDQSASY
jgi:chemotaxis-related protein WspB